MFPVNPYIGLIFWLAVGASLGLVVSAIEYMWKVRPQPNKMRKTELNIGNPIW